jgi:hypothetical protein
LIGNALAGCEHPELVARLAELVAVEDVAQSLSEGKATKLFLPRDPSNLFGLAATLSETLGTDSGTGHPEDNTESSP